MNAQDRAQQFLDISGEFKLGHLTTEQFHPLTRDLDQVAARSTADAIAQLLAVDSDVVRVFRSWLEADDKYAVVRAIVEALARGGRIVLVGCGATGRLSVQLEALWRRHWRRQSQVLADRVISVIAGGDYAVVRSVEGFEDQPELAALQLRDLALGASDVLFAITEGGETPFVIGAAEVARARRAKVFFVYCNPDSVLTGITRSRAILEDDAIHKINLVTGPMALSGSTRMQATTVQQLVLLSILEAVTLELEGGTADWLSLQSALAEGYAALTDDRTISALARVVEDEEAAHRAGLVTTYAASRLALDVLTDTTERSPTFSVPPFRKWDDAGAEAPWAQLLVSATNSAGAWRDVLAREPRCFDWSPADVRIALRNNEGADAIVRAVGEIGNAELLRYRIGLDGDWRERIRPGASVLVVTHQRDLLDATTCSFLQATLDEGARAGARTATILVGESTPELPVQVSVLLETRTTTTPLDPIGHALVKMALNAISTTLMARLGRVVGNCMAYVSPTNNKLIDRATRYVAELAALGYDDACRHVFAALQQVEPDMRAGREFTPVVPLALEVALTGSGLAEAKASIRTRGASK